MSAVRRRRRRLGGFTLAEVMIALAILGMSLTMLVRSIAGNIGAAQQSMYMGLVADLGRGKMYDIEEHLAQEGFKDTEEHEEGEFDDEGWPAIKWEYRVSPVELPSLEKLLGQDQGKPGSGSGSGEDADGDGAPDPDRLAAFQKGGIGQLIDTFTGGFGGDTGGDALGGAGSGGGANLGMISMIYPIVQDTLKKSIRKIVLTIRWDTGFEAEHIDFVMYVTDQVAMCKSMSMIGVCK